MAIQGLGVVEPLRCVGMCIGGGIELGGFGGWCCKEEKDPAGQEIFITRVHIVCVSPVNPAGLVNRVDLVNQIHSDERVNRNVAAYICPRPDDGPINLR